MPFIELDVLNNAPEPILGIDLGTTNSMVALWTDGRAKVLCKDERHSGSIPSAVYFPPSGPPVVGQAVRERALVDPSGTVFSIKRFMGRGKADVEEDLRTVPFECMETSNGLLQFNVHGELITPQQISALILQRVRQVASMALQTEAPQRAVITVPAYFDDAQRAATRDAAHLAGLDVARIINEPTAASLAYGLDQRKEGTVVVYDLGGGTFDVSILAIEEGVFRVLSTAGDTHLGGDDYDHAIVDWAMAELAEAVDAETLEDPAFRQALRLAAERAKMELSDQPSTDFHVMAPDRHLNFRKSLTREAFEALAAPITERTVDACRRALADAGLEPSQVDEVVLVGGSTRIPSVQARVEEFFGRAPHKELNPDQVVALGAAVQGFVLGGGTRDILLMDVTPLSLGLESYGGAVAKIIARNSPIPCQYTETFTTQADNQTGIDFNVLQGEREMAEDCRSLGRFKLSGIPPMPAGMARVAVRFELDADGILTVTAREEASGQTARIEIQPKHGLSDDDVERMLRESYDHAREDFDARRVADLQVEIATMRRATMAHLEEARSSLDAETVSDIEAALRAGDEAADERDADRVQKVRDELERATLPLAALLMDDVARAALSGKSLDEV